MKNKMDNKTMISFFGTIAGLAISIIVTFIGYMKAYGLFYSRHFSIYEIIALSLKEPEYMLGSSDDIFMFVFIVLGIIFTIISLVFILLKKRGTYIWVILAFLFLLVGTNGKAWLHFVGLGIALVFAIWYRVVCKKNK